MPPQVKIVLDKMTHLVSKCHGQAKSLDLTCKGREMTYPDNTPNGFLLMLSVTLSQDLFRINRMNEIVENAFGCVTIISNINLQLRIARGTFYSHDLG